MTISACLWLGLFPLLQGGTYASITYDKWVIMLVLTAFTFLCFLAEQIAPRSGASAPNGSRSPRARLSSRRLLPLILAAALLFWTVLSCVFSGSGPETWLIGKAGRYEGLVTHFCYFVLFVCFFFSRISLKPVLLSAAAGVTVFFTLVLFQRGDANPLGLYPAGRSYELNPEFQGTIGNIDMGTGYLLLLAGLFLCGILNAARGIRQSGFGFHLIPLFAAFLITIYLIVTMEVQFGIVSLAALVLFTLLRFLPKKWRLPLLIILIVLVLLTVWFWPGQGGGIWELHEILHGRSRLSFGSNRVAVWLYSLRLAGDAPLFGGGLATFVTRFNQYLADHSLAIPHSQDGVLLPHYFDNPHNEYIARLTDTGLPAMLLFLALLLFAVFHRRERWFPLLTPCSAAVLCYAVQAFFSFSICIVAPMFWVLLGQSFNE